MIDLTPLTDLFTEIGIINIFLALLGQSLHILARLKVLFERKERFVWRVWVVQNTINSLKAIIAMIVLMIILSKMNELTGTTSLLIGYCADSMLKSLMKRGKEKFMQA